MFGGDPGKDACSEAVWHRHFVHFHPVQNSKYLGEDMVIRSASLALSQMALKLSALILAQVVFEEIAVKILDLVAVHGCTT